MWNQWVLARLAKRPAGDLWQPIPVQPERRVLQPCRFADVNDHNEHNNLDNHDDDVATSAERPRDHDRRQ
jgi:hypothetical protein